MNQSGFNGMVTGGVHWIASLCPKITLGYFALKVGLIYDCCFFSSRVSGVFWLIFRVHSVHSVQVSLSIPDTQA